MSTVERRSAARANQRAAAFIRFQMLGDHEAMHYLLVDLVGDAGERTGASGVRDGARLDRRVAGDHRVGPGPGPGLPAIGGREQRRPLAGRRHRPVLRHLAGAAAAPNGSGRAAHGPGAGGHPAASPAPARREQRRPDDAAVVAQLRRDDRRPICSRGRNLSAFLLTPPPTTIRSGQSRSSTAGEVALQPFRPLLPGQVLALAGAVGGPGLGVPAVDLEVPELACSARARRRRSARCRSRCRAWPRRPARRALARRRTAPPRTRRRPRR